MRTVLDERFAARRCRPNDAMLTAMSPSTVMRVVGDACTFTPDLRCSPEKTGQLYEIQALCCKRFAVIWCSQICGPAAVAQWQSSCFVNSRSWVQVPPAAPRSAPHPEPETAAREGPRMSKFRT